MTSYWRAPEVEEIAEKLIAEHHTHLSGLRIRYVFRDKAAASRGRVVLGKARKVGGLNAHLVALVGRDAVDGPADFFVVEVAADTWEDLTAEQRVALVDHELCHLRVEQPDDPAKDRKLVVRGHDLEEFTDVVERHGLWRPPVAAFAAAAGQLTIEIGAADDVDDAGDTDDEPG